MSLDERRERERTERRELILNAASQIMNTEGVKGLSIRKIADRIEYSPALIYHYFKNKDAIVTALIKRGYERIIDGLRSVKVTSKEPDQRFKEFTRNYIQLALDSPEEYRRVMLANSAGVLKHTAVLFEGASKKRPSVEMVHKFLRDTYLKDYLDETFVERTVQVLWASMFGLIVRILIEEDLPKEQRERLIDHQIEIMLAAVKWLEENHSSEGDEK